MGGAASGPKHILYTAVRTPIKMHFKARSKEYPRNPKILRFPVPDDNVSWDVPFPDYQPVEYTAPSVASGPVWADMDIKHLDPKQTDVELPKWNSLDGKINRRSHMGEYKLDECNCPKNPAGRTGVCARGLLGRWGPNHAADPIVTRWKRDQQGNIVENKGHPVAQFMAVQRRDNMEWAIPGGMVDAGEVVNEAIRREFGEETLNLLEATPAEKREIEKNINQLFAHGTEVYRGYVDDPRNTDNAWMETVAMNFHDDKGHSVAKFNFKAGDDAAGVEWLDLDSSLKLFASHVDFLKITAQKLKAHW